VTVVTSPKLFTVAPLHASDAVGVVNDGVTLQLIVVLAAALPIVGGVVSMTVMAWLTVALWFPQASVASQRRVIVLLQLVPVVISPRLFTVAPLQASVAVGGVNVGVTLQLMVVFPPAFPMVGAMSSMIRMDWDTVAL